MTMRLPEVAEEATLVLREAAESRTRDRRSRRLRKTSLLYEQNEQLLAHTLEHPDSF